MLTDQTPDIILDQIPPGQHYSKTISLSLVDTYGNIIITDSYSVLYLQILPTYQSLFLTGTTSFTAINGTFTIADFIP